jgi:hypothetical protein
MKRVSVTATLVRAADLKPGELFTTYGQIYWDMSMSMGASAIGERVYIRTNTPAGVAPDKDVEVYRITINPVCDTQEETTGEGK